MIQTKVRIHLGDVYDEIGHMPEIPVSIPEMDELLRAAWVMHTRGARFDGELWGWSTSYEPEVQESVPSSRLSFRPAVFSIGAYPFWFVSLTWEHGADSPPAMFVMNENLTDTHSYRPETLELRMKNGLHQ